MSRFVWEVLLWPVWALVIAGYVAWRFLTCCVDSWDDIRHGRTPLFWRTGQLSSWRDADGGRQ